MIFYGVGDAASAQRAGPLFVGVGRLERARIPGLGPQDGGVEIGMVVLSPRLEEERLVGQVLPLPLEEPARKRSDHEVALLHRTAGDLLQLGGAIGQLGQRRRDHLTGDLARRDRDRDAAIIRHGQDRPDFEGRLERQGPPRLVVDLVEDRSVHRQELLLLEGPGRVLAHHPPDDFLPDVLPESLPHDIERDLPLSEAGYPRVPGVLLDRFLELFGDLLARDLDLETALAAFQLVDHYFHQFQYPRLGVILLVCWGNDSGMEPSR